MAVKVVLFFFFKIFICLFERENEQGERQREKQIPHGAGKPTQGWIPGPWDHDLSQRQLLNHLSHSGVPVLFFCLFVFFKQSV